MRRRIPLLVLLLSVIILAGIPLSIAQSESCGASASI